MVEIMAKGIAEVEVKELLTIKCVQKGLVNARVTSFSPYSICEGRVIQVGNRNCRTQSPLSYNT